MNRNDNSRLIAIADRMNDIVRQVDEMPEPYRSNDQLDELMELLNGCEMSIRNLSLKYDAVVDALEGAIPELEQDESPCTNVIKALDALNRVDYLKVVNDGARIVIAHDQ